MTNVNEPAIKLADSANVDGGGRLRTGHPFPVFDSKHIFNKNLNQWEEDTSGVGASATHLPNEAAIDLTVGTVSDEYVIRQTIRYHAYIPGKTQFILMTGVLGAGKSNVTRRLGYFDANDGLFFELADSTLKIVRRTSTSGGIVDNDVSQSSWNLDKMDGTGASGITIDTTKDQIFVIDFLWLGAGRIRFGFKVDDGIIYCHQILIANVIDTAFMATPSLPVRYEIRNTGTAASSSSLKEICSSISSEGGYTLPGFEFAASMGVTTKSVTTRAPILAVRLKDSFNSKDNRRTARFLRAVLYNDADAFFEVAHLHTPSSITATWSDVGGGSAVEMASGANITAVTGNPEHIIEQRYTTAGVGSAAANGEVDSSFVNLHSYISQNMASDNSQIFVVYATRFAGTTNVAAGISWLEFD